MVCITTSIKGRNGPVHYVRTMSQFSLVKGECITTVSSLCRAVKALLWTPDPSVFSVITISVVFYLMAFASPLAPSGSAWRSCCWTGSDSTVRRLRAWGGGYECRHESDKRHRGERTGLEQQTRHGDEWPVLWTSVNGNHPSLTLVSETVECLLIRNCSSPRSLAVEWGGWGGVEGVTPNTIRKHGDRFACFQLPLSFRMFCF